MSPTAPTFVTLNDRLTKAHRRIRELEARETELLAHNRALRAVIEELTNKDDSRTAAELVSLANEAIDGSGISDRPGKHTSHGAGPVARSQASADTQCRPAHTARAPTASKRGGSLMFDLDPIGTTFLIIAVLWLIAAVAYGRDDR